MVIFDGFDLIVLAVGASLLFICGIIIIVDHIACTMKKRRQKHKDKR